MYVLAYVYMEKCWSISLYRSLTKRISTPNSFPIPKTKNLHVRCIYLCYLAVILSSWIFVIRLDSHCQELNCLHNCRLKFSPISIPFSYITDLNLKVKSENKVFCCISSGLHGQKSKYLQVCDLSFLHLLLQLLHKISYNMKSIVLSNARNWPRAYWAFSHWAIRQRHGAVPVSWGLRFNASLGTVYTHTHNGILSAASFSQVVVAGIATFLVLEFAIKVRWCKYGGIDRVKVMFMGQNVRGQHR